MATTTAKAFSDFGEKLRLTPNQETTVRQRRSRVAQILGDAFPASSNMPLTTTRIIGSANRNTIIRPLDDVDVLAVFDDTHVWSTYQYDSTKFLYRIRDALTQYNIQLVGARGQAVRLFYTQPPHVDIAAVVPYGSQYLIPRGDGAWLVTDPDGVDKLLGDRQTALGGNLRPLVRLLKRWNNVHSKRMRSFHLEMVAQTTFSSLSSNMRTASMRFFEWAGNYLDVADPTSGESLGSRLTWTQRQNILDSFSTAHGRAQKAVNFEAGGDHASAIGQWKLVFGNEFPSYG
jgi:hypothetical protein